MFSALDCIGYIMGGGIPYGECVEFRFRTADDLFGHFAVWSPVVAIAGVVFGLPLIVFVLRKLLGLLAEAAARL